MHPSPAPTSRRCAALLTTLALLLGLTATLPTTIAVAAPAPVGQGFTVTPADLAFILKQIKIAERHSRAFLGTDPAIPVNPNPSGDPNYCQALVGPGADQIPDRLTSYGLRTVDGSCNNLFAGRESWAAADLPFPRLSAAVFRAAEPITSAFPVGRPGPTSYAQKSGSVVDTQPRVISNLIADQTSANPAAVVAAAFPVRSQNNPGTFPCTTDPDLLASPPVDGVPAGCVPTGQTLDIPNVTTDAGLSPPYNSLFTYFGQFFDHGVDQTVKGGGTVFVPLRADDPLILGADRKAGTADDLPASMRFMVLTRAKNQPGPDGVSGTADDVTDALNTDSPWIDQSQTYSSHASHQAFLREYTIAGGPDDTLGTADDRPVPTGRLLGGLDAGQTYPGSPDGRTGMSTWAAVKRQAATQLGLELTDADVTNVPMLAMDPYGNFVPGPLRGLPQYVTVSGLVEGDLSEPVRVPADVRSFDTPFLTDIAHNADPSPVDTDHNPATPPVAPRPDDDTVASADFGAQPAGTYDDEMLDAHFACGDGRCNENIALSAIHQVFHSEHDRLVDDIKRVLTADTSAAGVAALAQWKAPIGTAADGWNGSRLFQAARFITEMEYQHAVFEDFGRKVQPAIRAFRVYSPDIQPAVDAEFAHAVYRFGHSMLNDEVARTNVDGAGTKTDNSLPLLTAFLNPPAYFDGGAAGTLSPARAAGSVLMGSSDQIGNELDEFVTETLRNNLLGLPLDLATLNLTRARDAGVPSLNAFRRDLAGRTNDGQLAPYTSWSDFGQHLRHPASLVNFVAAYGTHPTIRDSGPDGVKGTADDVNTVAAKRAAARLIVDPPSGTDPAAVPADAGEFMFADGAWADDNGLTTTGLEDVDLWIGGLAETTNMFGGLLGSTFNYVFQAQMEKLQDGDRLYYLARTPGLNLRVQLEGNSFAELVQRNTEGTSSLKADAFAVADCRFQLGNLVSPAPTGSFITGIGSIADDASTPDCNENRLLVKQPNGTIAYRTSNSVDRPGINGQAVYNGTDRTDRVKGGVDNDTFWGGAGNDVIEGNSGDDVALGGEGDDILTDLGGDDFSKGGPGDDAVDGGPGLDVVLGGDGADVLNGGAGDNQVFGGAGTDFIIAGQGGDAVFGDGGDDWIQGGTGQDLLQGDHGAPFFDDPAQTAPGNDIFIGQPGENDYDAEGGDDLMAQNAAIDRNAGAGGFDWAFHQYDTVAADDDMEINNNLAGLALQVVTNRDRWQETEAVSGGSFDDVIKGTSVAPKTLGGGFTGCDAIDAAGVARIAGLDQLITEFPSDLAPIVASSAPGACPLEGPTVWGEGDVLIGGAGSDTITGRGADDIIDGDRYLQVRISVRSDPADPATEIATTDLLERPALTGSFGPGTTATTTLQQAVFAGLVDPGDLVAVRSIVTPAPLPADCGTAGPKNCDTAVFQGPASNYEIAPGAAAGQVRVRQTGASIPGQKSNDGTDTLTNVERLQFTDTAVVLSLPGTPTVGTATVTANDVDGTATLSWTAATSELPLTGYLVRAVPVGTEPGGPGTVTGGPITDGTADTGVVEGLTLGTAYQLQVQALNPLGAGPWSGLSNAVTPTPPVKLPVVTLTRPGPFPATAVGTVSAPQNITVNNIGRGALTINGVTLEGATPQAFSIDASGCPATLPSLQSCTVAVRFAPTAAGTQSAVVAIADNATGAPHRATVSGTGTAPVASLTGSGTFADTVVGSTSAASTVTLANTGAAPLDVTAVEVTGSGAASFGLDRTGCGPTVAVGASCPLLVTFTPSTVGPVTAALSVTDNAAGSPHTVALTGTGLPVPPPVMTVTGPTAFPDTLTGTTAAAQTISIANAGPGTLTLTGVALGGADAGAFTVDRGACPAALTAGSSCAVAVRFTPPTAGTFTATVTVAADAVDPQVVTVTGRGILPPPAPIVTGRTPAADATGVSPAANVSATFDLPMTGVSTTTFVLKQGTTVIPATVTQVAGTEQWVLDPTADLATSTTYTVTLTGGGTAIRSTAGTPLATVSWSFTTAAPADTTPPTVTGRIPASSATAVAVGVTVTATFSEALAPATVTSANATLRPGTSATATPVTAALTWNATTRTLTLDPAANLAPDTRYTVRLGAGLKDLAGNALVALNWTFLTGPAPTVTAVSPAANTFAVAVGANVTGTFSEAVTGVSGTTVQLRVGTTATGTLIPATVTYNATTRTATLDPTGNLAPDTRYTVRMSSGITDLAGNPVTAASATFTTGPAPTVTGRTPGINATGFNRTANITATLSETVVAARVTGTSVTLRVGTSATGTLVPAVVSWNATTRVVTLNPNATLAANTRYTVRLDPSITDAVGNPLAATSWTFTTGG